MMNTRLQTLLLLCVPLLILFLSLHIKADGSQRATPPTIAMPGCPDRCGNISIPFPFGIGDGCFHDSWFEIRCNSSNKKPFLPGFHNFEVMEITIPHYGNQWLQSVTVGMPSQYSCGANHTKKHGVDLRGTPFNFSTNHNVFLMEGCQGSTLLFDQSDNKPLVGCSTACRNKNDSRRISANKCYGDVDECCQMDLPLEPSYPGILLDHYHYYDDADAFLQRSALKFYEIGFYGGQSSRNCLAATLIKNDSVGQYIGKLLTSNQYQSVVPVLLYWRWLNNSSPYSNRHNHCERDEGTNSTDCRCKGDSAGNPYVFDGCQQQAACTRCRCCTWKEGTSSYYCQVADNDSNFSTFTILLIFIIFVAVSTLALVFGCRGLFLAIKRRKKTERRVKIFKLKLQQHRSSNEGVVEKTKIFTHTVLKEATDHFNENRILGKGGQGTVYKGMLSDGTIVAIKKSSKLEDESQMEQFINEVVVLSRVNHRNVVKILGCCLETEVPLLVYEFISNGTLSQHIHYPSEDFVLTWAMRLKIAAESAGAVAYLHSSSSTPVYHRDIKPANILLDDKHRAKVSDFGSSKTIEIDQTHLTTLVQGTFGYLDPEYFESGIFTEKSDVYSFGVVLLELLTSKKPIYRDATMEQKALVVEFFLHEQSSNLMDLLDLEVVQEAKEEELRAVVDLAKRCLHGSGRWRPTMREVAMTLEMLVISPTEMSTHDQQAPPYEGFSEIFMSKMSEINFLSSPVRARTSSPLYIDVHSLLHDTI